MKATEKGVSVALLNELLFLDSENGRLFWKKRRPELFTPKTSRTPKHAAAHWNARYANKLAFYSLSSTGYHRGRIFTKSFFAHRVIYAIFHGTWPEDQIDHIDGNPLNNIPSNLRDAPQTLNMRNTSLRPDNKSGVVGVCWVEKDKRWRASISGSKRIHLGQFKTLEEAKAAREAAEIEFGYHKNHGRVA